MITICPRSLTKAAITASLLLSVLAVFPVETRAQVEKPPEPNVQTPNAQDKTTSELPLGAKKVQAVAIVKTDAAQIKIDKLKKRLADTANKFGKKGLSDDDFARLEAEALVISGEAEDITLEFQPRVQSIEQRLAELKPVGEGAVQSESAKLEEESQRKILAELGGVMQQAQVVAIQAADLSILVTQKRRVRFSERLFHRDNSTLDPDFWSDVKVAVPRLLWRASLWTANWRKQATLRIDLSLAIIFAVALLATIYLIIHSRSYVLKRVARDPHEEPRQSRRVIAALFVMVVNLTSAAIVSLLLYLFLDGIRINPRTV